MSTPWEISAGLDGLRPPAGESTVGVEAGQVPETDLTEPGPLGLARYEVLKTMHTEFFGKDFEEMGDPSTLVNPTQLEEPIFATLQELQKRGLISEGITSDQVEKIYAAVMERLEPVQQLLIHPEDITRQVDRTIEACNRFGHFDVRKSLLEEEE